MQNFDVKNIDDWVSLPEDASLSFRVNRSARSIKLKLNTDCKVRVWISNDLNFENRVLLAAASGIFTVSATISRESYVLVERPSEGNVFYATSARDHIRKKVAEQVFTTVVPMQSENSEFERMQMLMQYNQRVMFAQIEKERLENQRQMSELMEQIDGKDLQQTNPATMAAGGAGETQSQADSGDGKTPPAGEVASDTSESTSEAS